jgi:hypothetical protein
MASVNICGHRCHLCFKYIAPIKPGEPVVLDFTIHYSKFNIPPAAASEPVVLEFQIPHSKFNIPPAIGRRPPP